MKFAIIGHGAAGTFAALRLRECLLEKGRTLDEDEILIIEKNRQGLRKVKISGGGRCNVTHFEFDPKEFASNYPRGNKELIGPFHQFQAGDTIDWFAKRGVELKNESDGRMFPITNSSQTIIDCFEKELERFKIKVLTQKEIQSLEHAPDTSGTKATGFNLRLRCKRTNSEESLSVTALMLATGSDPSGYKAAESMGHTITELAPSLFTFKIKDPLLKDLAGTSFKNSQITVEAKGKKWVQTGPLLITHWGLSGPAILKISAWAARELKDVNYHFPVSINFMDKSPAELKTILEEHWKENGKKLCQNSPLTPMTKNFWSNLIGVVSSSHPKLRDKTNQDLSNKEKEAIVSALIQYSFKSAGSHRFKEEFVECGGVSNTEVNFKTMESKLVKGLFFAGEILNIDGITGGFNFQNAWTGGHIAGTSMAEFHKYDHIAKDK